MWWHIVLQFIMITMRVRIRTMTSNKNGNKNDNENKKLGCSICLFRLLYNPIRFVMHCGSTDIWCIYHVPIASVAQGWSGFMPYGKEYVLRFGSGLVEPKP